MKKILLFLTFAICFAETTTAQQALREKEEERRSINGEIAGIDRILNDNENPWIRRHNSYTKYNSINNQIKSIEWQLKRIKPTDKNTEQIQVLSNRLETLNKQKQFFAYEDNLYKELVEIKEIENIPKITNPLTIFSGFSFLKQIKVQEKTLQNNQKTLQETLQLLEQKKDLLTQLLKIESKAQQYEILAELQKIQSIKLELQSAQSILETSIELYERRVAELDSSITDQIQKQILNLIYILILCVVVFFIALATKLALRKYLDHERLYIANKIINFSYITIIFIILLLSYLNNITYLVTFLGFVSAGLAFAMRDLFMSFLGWFVIVIGGGLHAGDRIRIHRDNTTYVGDILDISMTRITLLEDVTLNTYSETRRAGRIIFIPNNFIFNTVISNYTHGGMTTIWDGIDFTVTFDSNFKKAVDISTEVARKYSKAHIEIGKKRMSRLKERYSLKRISLEPRVFNMIEPNGMRISVWYQTNAFTTLNVRSNISSEIIELLAQEKDIKIAYPTTKIVNTGSDGVWERYTHEENNETKSIF